MTFLNQLTCLYAGHWGNWQISIDPQVFSIVLNRDYSQAAVHSRIVNRGAEAHFVRIDNEWKMIDAKLTWIPRC